MRNILLIIILLIPFYTFTFEVQPMMADLEPLGRQSQVNLRITNTSEQTLTLEISSSDLQIAPTGEEKLVVNNDDFLIIPMTTIVLPGKSQSVIVKYIGEPLLEESKSYRINVRQLAINLEEKQSKGVGLNFYFQTLYNVVPKNAKAKLAIKNKQQAAEGVWDIQLENKGNKYIRLTKRKWVIEGQNEKLILDGQRLNAALSHKLLLPNSSRTVSLKVPPQFNALLSKLTVVNE